MSSIDIEIQQPTGSWLVVRQIDADMGDQYLFQQMTAVQKIHNTRVRAKKDGRIVDILN